MGFSSGFYVYPKYNSVTYDQLRNIELVLDYENNSWAQERYDSAEAYGKSNDTNFSMPSLDVLDFYRNNLIENEYGNKYIWKDICILYSNGIELDKWLTEELDNLDDGHIILSFNDVIKVMEHCTDIITNHLPEPCNVNYAFRLVGDIENPDILSTPCNGIEVSFDSDGSNSRIYTDSESDFMLTRNYISSWELDGYVVCLQGCLTILKTVDFENNFVVYNGGW